MTEIQLKLLGTSEESVDWKIIEGKPPQQWVWMIQQHGVWVDYNDTMNDYGEGNGTNCRSYNITRKLLGDLDEDFMHYQIHVEHLYLRITTEDARWLSHNPVILDARDFVLGALFKKQNIDKIVELFNEYEKFKEL